MKKAIVLLLALLWAFGARAQYAVPEWHQGDLTKKGTVLALHGMKLNRADTEAILNQVGGSEMVDSWNKYCRERGWGIGLTAGGFTLAAAGLGFGGVYFVAGVVGTIFAAIGGQEMLAGLAAGTTGIVLLSVGNSNLKKLAKTCDAAGLGPQPGVQLAFGPAPSGMGLVLYF